MLFVSGGRLLRKLRKSIFFLSCFVAFIYLGFQFLEFRKEREINRFRATLQTHAVNPAYVAASEDYQLEAKKVIERARKIKSR